jgi:phosphatidate cytidylyltransferase
VLKQRVVTAVILSVLILGVLFGAPAWSFGVVVLLVTSVAAWEWANLCNTSSIVGRILYSGLLLLTGCSVGWRLYTHDWLALQQVLLPACLWWLMALLWIKSYPKSAGLWQTAWMRHLMGFVVLIPCALSLMYLRLLPDGSLMVATLVGLVAAADIGAYFAGRAFGRHKLAPQVSPGKSWEGVFGGVFCVMTIGLTAAVWQNLNPLITLAVILPVGLASVVGDLLESMLKRHRGIKDSGVILPGHGGVLDRIDGLMAAAPVFAFALIIARTQG